MPTIDHPPTSLPSPVSPILNPSILTQDSCVDLSSEDQTSRKTSQSGSEVWTDVDDSLSALPTDLSPTVKRESEQSNVQRVPFKIAKTTRRSSADMPIRRHGPRKVPGDVINNKKSLKSDELRGDQYSVLTVSSGTTAVSQQSSGSDRTIKQKPTPPMEADNLGTLLQHHDRQQTAFGEAASEQHIVSPSDNLERIGSPLHKEGPGMQWSGPFTSEGAGKQSVPRPDGPASLPSPQPMRFGDNSSNPPETPSQLGRQPAQGSAWNGQRSGDLWSADAGRPRSGVSLFHQPGPQAPLPFSTSRHGQLPQSPRSNIRLEDQVEALRDHIASQQRPAGSSPGGSMPGAYWQYPQMYPTSPQVQRAGFNGQGIRSARPSQAGLTSPSPATAKSPSTPSFPNLDQTTLAGYELLASRLTDGTLGARPMYRSFEQLHHRLLLYLQDEICEYEEELRNLDEWISQVGSALSDGKPKPASRRAEARLTPADSELMFRRKFVLGEIFVKLERYHRALESYSNAAINLQRPQEAEVTRYSEWMSANRPVDMAEAAFLKHDKDLFVIPRRKVEVSTLTTATMAILLLTLLLPLIMFAMMPNSLCLIIAILVCGIGQWALCSATDIKHVLTPREWLFSAVAYVGFTTLIAVVAH